MCPRVAARSYEADGALVQRGWATHVLGRGEHSFKECAPPLRAHMPACLCCCEAAAQAMALTSRLVAVCARSPLEAVTELRKIKPNDQYLPSFVITDGDNKARAAHAHRRGVVCN